MSAHRAQYVWFFALTTALGCSSQPHDDVSSGGSSNGGTSNAAGGSPTSAGGSSNVAGSSPTSAAGGSNVAGGSPNSGGSSNAAGGAPKSVGGMSNAAGGATSSAAGGSNVAGGSPNSGGSSNAGSGNGGATGADVIATFHNGVFWNDTSGNRIEAHGGGFILVDGTWYWIGEDKSQNNGNFKAVNCYASKDLEHWEFRHAIITRNTTSSLAAADRIIERPKVVYNETTKKYVMWLHWDGQSYAEAKAGVFTSDTVDGDYTYVNAFRPNNNMARDDILFKDDDGKAYFAAAANENADMALYSLSDDYLSATQIATLWAGSKREAPAIFKSGTRYFFITSAATGWDPNQAKYSTATSMKGPWSSLSNLGDSTTYDTQSAYVIPVKGSKTTTYIYAGDRWQDPDLKSSKYIWLPLKVSDSKVVLDNYKDWQLNVTTGEWSANTDDGFLSQSGWKLLYADSEETQGEDGAATNAFDNSASTYWHTAWDNGGPHPHEIQIDLGDTYTVTGFRYLPRQDKDDHGMVAKYAFYASIDSKNWGDPVAMGTFTNTRSETKVNFASMQAHYIRFVALSEINGNDWTSVAELDLMGSKM